MSLLHLIHKLTLQYQPLITVPLKAVSLTQWPWWKARSEEGTVETRQEGAGCFLPGSSGFDFALSCPCTCSVSKAAEWRCPAHSASRVDCSSETSQPAPELGTMLLVFPVRQHLLPTPTEHQSSGPPRAGPAGLTRLQPRGLLSLPEWVSHAPALTSWQCPAPFQACPWALACLYPEGFFLAYTCLGKPVHISAIRWKEITLSPMRSEPLPWQRASLPTLSFFEFFLIHRKPVRIIFTSLY